MLSYLSARQTPEFVAQRRRGDRCGAPRATRPGPTRTRLPPRSPGPNAVLPRSVKSSRDGRVHNPKRAPARNRRPKRPTLGTGHDTGVSRSDKAQARCQLRYEPHSGQLRCVRNRPVVNTRACDYIWRSHGRTCRLSGESVPNWYPTGMKQMHSVRLCLRALACRRRTHVGP